MKRWGLLFFCFYFVIVKGDPLQFTCYHNPSKFWVEQGIDKKGVAWGNYYEELNQTGWSRLYIESNSNADDDLQAYCAGTVFNINLSHLDQDFLNQF